MKISKKELKRIGENNAGYYFTGDVYSYENVVFYIQQLIWRTEKGTKTRNKKRRSEIKKELEKNINSKYKNDLIKLIDKIENISHDNYSVNQLYYSDGLYGNSGQLHEIKLYNKENIVDLFYLYY